MPKMHTTVHFTLDLPHATPEEMRQAEQLMRDPDYIEAALASMNAVANLQAKKAGVAHKIVITGTIHDVAHEA